MVSLLREGPLSLLPQLCFQTQTRRSLSITTAGAQAAAPLLPSYRPLPGWVFPSPAQSAREGRARAAFNCS